MVIIKEKKKQTEAGNVIKKFTVDYWGVKVTYNVLRHPDTGNPYCVIDDNIHKVEELLQKKTNDIFMASQRRAGMYTPVASSGYGGDVIPLGTSPIRPGSGYLPG